MPSLIPSTRSVRPSRRLMSSMPWRDRVVPCMDSVDRYTSIFLVSSILPFYFIDAVCNLYWVFLALWSVWGWGYVGSLKGRKGIEILLIVLIVVGTRGRKFWAWDEWMVEGVLGYIGMRIWLPLLECLMSLLWRNGYCRSAIYSTARWDWTRLTMTSWIWPRDR